MCSLGDFSRCESRKGSKASHSGITCTASRGRWTAVLGVTSFDSKYWRRTTNCTHIFNIFKLNSTAQVSANMSRTFRLFQTNHLLDKDVFMEGPDVEKINENSKKKINKSRFAKDRGYSQSRFACLKHNRFLLYGSILPDSQNNSDKWIFYIEVTCKLIGTFYRMCQDRNCSSLLIPP